MSIHSVSAHATPAIRARWGKPAAFLGLVLSLAACDDRIQPLSPSEPGSALVAGHAVKPGMIAYADTESGRIYIIGEDGTGSRPVTSFDIGYRHQDPHFMPGNRAILFARRQGGSGDSELYSISPDGRRLRQLTTLGGVNQHPSASPNGKQVAFIHDEKVWLMNANGGDAHQLVFNPSRFSSPTWSFDGSRLAFALFNPANSTHHIGVYDVTQGGWYTVQCATACYTPRWSPKSDVLVVEVEDAGVPGISTLKYLNPANGAVTPFEAAPAGLNHVGGWSPDGTRFVFSSTRSDPSGDLFVLDGQGTVTPLTSGLAGDRQPSWSR
jgi:Tol biopolymer transport system component